jgi:heme exporter protein CcmD
MPHAPFIIASYLTAAALLIWCAVTPLIQSKNLKRSIRARNHATEPKNAPNS